MSQSDNNDDLRHTEQELRERERQLDSLMGHLPGLAYRAIADEHWTCLFVSKGIEVVTGYSPDDFTSRRVNYIDIMLPEDRQATRQAILTALKERGTYEDEHRVRHKDGSIRWIWARGHGVFAPDGSLRFIEGLNLDMTRQKQAEERLRESEQRWRILTETLPQLVWSATPDGTCDYFSSQWTEHTGVAEAELLGWQWLEALHPDDRAPTRRFWLESVAGRHAYDIEYRVRHKGGEYRWFKTRGVPIRDAGGNIVKWFGTCTDITELRDSEERFRSTFENAAVGIAHVDAQHRCLRANGVFCELLGYSRAEAFGMMIEEAVYADDQAVNLAQFDLVMRGDLPSFTMEKRFIRKDREVVWANVTVSLQRDAANNPAYCIVVAQDISERKRLEAELGKAHARLDLAVRGSNIGILEADMPDGILENARVTLVNLWGLLGYDRNECPTNFAQRMAIVHPDDQTRVLNAMKNYLSGDSGELEVEHRNRHKDGSYRWLLTRGVAVCDPAGKPIRFIGTSVDITELKHAQEALRESEERFRGTFENAAVGIVHNDPSGGFLRVNEKYCTILGYSREELLQMNLWEIIHADDRAAFIELYESCYSRDEVPASGLERRYLRKDGSTVWVEAFASFQRDASGRPAYAIAAVQDVSERKRLDEELRRAKEAAESANRAKDEFLANVSHEIRTPMNAILGMTELVLDAPLAEEQRRCLKTVKSAADSLLGMINDLLDFSKIEAGKLVLESADFSLRSVLGDTLRVLAIRAHKKGLELVSHVHANVPDALIGDAARLRQILLNLVGNAIKFTERGEVVINCRLQIAGRLAETSQDPQSATCNLQFEITDTGIGIAPDKLGTIFGAFEQEDTSTTRKYGGTGLGLTIAARLVSLMSGTISVASEPGRGTAFTFTACLARQAHPQAAVADLPPPQLNNLPVLIVDDNDTNRHILGEWLRGWQMEPTSVGDGMAAMDALWHRAANGRPYALVLLDARMPDTDGLAVAAMIRERAELAATRIILLTSGDRPGDLNRSRDLRIEAHLLKPVQQDDLLETIYTVMSRSTSSTPATTQSPPVSINPPAPVTAATPLSVLVAEDNDLSAQVLEQVVLRQGHHVRLATNGKEALALAEAGGFDILLLDVHMPEMDGFQVVQAIRARELAVGGRLPVIALTARSRKEDREGCVAAGMDDFLTKPVRPADLWEAIDRVLSTRSQEPGDRSQESGSLIPDSSPLTAGLLDAPVLLAACGGDPNLLAKMCQALRERIPEHLSAIQAALRDQDAQRLREAAHKCCGLLSEFSTVAGDLAGDLEDLAAGARLEKAPPILEKLEEIAGDLVRQTKVLSIEWLRKHTGRQLKP